MRRVIYPICLTLLLYFLYPATTNASSSPFELDHLADKALTYTQFGQYDQANEALQQFKKSISLAPLSMKKHDLRVLTTTFDQAEAALQAKEMDKKERVAHVKRFRLAFDATHSTYQPLWVGMEHSVMTAFDQMKAALTEGNTSLYHEQLNEFLAQYSIVQPSITVDIATNRVQEVHTRVQYVDRFRQDIMANDTSYMEVEKLEYDLRELFEEMTLDEADPSFWWVMFTTGGIIISTLSYVGVRKYRGEKEKKQPKRLRD